jgi:anti-anti-sigma factor
MVGSIFKEETKGGVTVLTLTLDTIPLYENERLKRAFTKILDEGKKFIILDLSGTDYISSIVLASLVFMRKQAIEAGGNLAICCVKNTVKDILSLTNLDKVFDIFDSQEEALDSLKQK